MRSLAVYTLLRLAVFAASFVAVWAVLRFGVGAAPLLLVALIAIVVTFAVSLVAFRRQARAAGGAVLGGFALVRRKVEAVASREDVVGGRPSAARPAGPAGDAARAVPAPPPATEPTSGTTSPAGDDRT